ALVPVPQALPALLAPVPKEKRLPPSLLVVGDVDFDSAETAPAADTERGAPRGMPKGWKKLDGTQAEAAAVKDLFGQLFKKGILTALEVSEMDLGKCELAVLSACQTGLGKEAGGEGLLGLQRAFQVAGARSSVASLWEVHDEATRRLMTGFYRAWWDPKKIIS